MLQILGAMMIVLSGALLGFYQASQLANRPKRLREFIQVLQRLETEIVYGMNPLPHALEHISKTITGPISQILLQISQQLLDPTGKTTSDVWNQVIEDRWFSTSLKAVEKEPLLQLGSSLGVSDREDQMKHLQLAINQLQTIETSAREDHQRFGKMWKSLGWLAGALIVVLMY